MSHLYIALRLLAASVIVASVARAQTCTRIQDTLYGPHNRPLTSATLHISASAIVDNGGRTTLPAPLTVTATNGRLNVCLVPNSYTVDYSTPSTLSHTWVVPASSTPLRVPDVEQPAPPAPGPALPALPTADGLYRLVFLSGKLTWQAQ